MQEWVLRLITQELLHKRGEGIPSRNDLKFEPLYDDINEDVYLDGSGFYNEPTDTAGIWGE